MAPEPHPHLVITPRGPVTVVHLNDRKLDDPTAQLLGDRLVALADVPGQTELHLDMGDVEYVSSTALGKLVALHKRAAAAGTHLVLLNVRPFVHEIFCITRLDRLLDVRPAVGEGARGVMA